ncbi:MAG: hypothetical protein HKN23_05600 [Verrucomicrobiales bacterium]|nr:hypothetical protein [Verrucomicrobiales bacterium]
MSLASGIGVGEAEARNKTSLYSSIKDALAARKARKFQPVPQAPPRQVRHQPQVLPAPYSRPVVMPQATVRPYSRPVVMPEPIPPTPPLPAVERRPARKFSTPSAVQEMRSRAESISRMGLPYKFGGESPAEGGMDCSGTMQYLLTGMGVPNVPRTSYAQFEWLKKSGNLRRKGWGSEEFRNLRPGDLIFWGGTYNSGHKVSHVMLYLGQDASGRHFMFGARSKSTRGRNGAGVDIFELKPGKHGNLIGYGRVPGLQI